MKRLPATFKFSLMIWLCSAALCCSLGFHIFLKEHTLFITLLTLDHKETESLHTGAGSSAVLIVKDATIGNGIAPSLLTTAVS